MITEKWPSIIDWEPVYHTKKVPETIHFIHLEQDCESNLLLGLLSMQSMLRCKICNERDLEPCQNVSMSLISKPCFLLAYEGKHQSWCWRKLLKSQYFAENVCAKIWLSIKGNNFFDLWAGTYLEELSSWYTKHKQWYSL